MRNHLRMSADSVSSASPAVLTQFLRGIGKRGYVLAEAQCGEIARAQRALATTIAEFREVAAHIALAHWPEHFWQRLLAQPILRPYTAAPFDDPLAHLSAGPRAALLLRLVAGLDNARGAAVLRVSPPAYRQALTGALHALHELGVDQTALRALQERLQQRIKALPEQFLQAPSQPRARPHPHAARSPARSRPLSVERSDRASSRWLRPTLRAALVALVLLFLATFLHLPAHTTSAIRIERLPEQAVAAKLSPTAQALASPDFELLGDVDGERDARDLALLSWVDAAPAASQGIPQAMPTSPALPESATPETSEPETSAPDSEQTEGGQPGAP